jgi:hypothetical protein
MCVGPRRILEWHRPVPAARPGIRHRALHAGSGINAETVPRALQPSALAVLPHLAECGNMTKRGPVSYGSTAPASLPRNSCCVDCPSQSTWRTYRATFFVSSGRMGLYRGPYHPFTCTWQRAPPHRAPTQGFLAKLSISLHTVAQQHFSDWDIRRPKRDLQ